MVSARPSPVLHKCIDRCGYCRARWLPLSDMLETFVSQVNGGGDLMRAKADSDREFYSVIKCESQEGV